MNRIPTITDKQVFEGKLLAQARRSRRLALPDSVRVTGIMRMTFMTADGYEQRTPHGVKTLLARRARNKVAKQARKVNRRYKAHGGLR